MLKKSSKFWVAALLLCTMLLFPNAVLGQYEIPPVPDRNQQRAVFQFDSLQVLSPNQVTDLNSKLIRYADSTSTQFLVALIRSTKGEDISLLGARWGETWGIGQAGKDNGIVIVLAHEDRTIDINTGYGTETQLTDRMAEQIINRIIVPEFKSGDFYGGLDRGTDAIFEALNGTFEMEADEVIELDSDPPNYLWIFWLFVGFCLFIFIIPIIMVFKGVPASSGRGSRTYSSSGTSSSYSSSSSSRSSSSYSSSSSSSSSSYSGGYGGGSFGGGGASGSW